MPDVPLCGGPRGSESAVRQETSRIYTYDLAVIKRPLASISTGLTGWRTSL
ncbi:hypothetical protein M404DRAFT_995098, partial [Pisolithus tinctorius Marx 270]